MCLAIPGKVENLLPNSPIAEVRFGGVVRKCDLSYVPDAGVGDYVLVHAGFALSKVLEEDAQYVQDFLKGLPRDS